MLFGIKAHVTETELNTYRATCREFFRDHFKEKPRTTLWHYATAKTAIDIISSGKVWATQISCLNDHTEYKYSIGLVRDALEPFSKGDNKIYQLLADKIRIGLEDDAADRSAFFVFCLSEKKDDLSQWRAYGGGEGGLALGFHELRLHPALEGSRKLVHVCYNKQDQDAFVEKVVAKTFEFYMDGLRARGSANPEQWADEFLSVWRDELLFFAPMMKHPGFASEEEWRLIYGLHASDEANLTFLQRENLMSCHLPMQLWDQPKMLPLKEVMIGPCRHKEVSWASAWRLLKKRGYPLNESDETDPNKVSVTKTILPFQNA